MAILTFFLNLTGAIMLLLFAVRMVRTGIERSFGASFQRWLTESTSLIGSGVTGIMLALILQNSAAVALLTSGFAAAGYLAFPGGLAVVLGGDLGSALIIQVLSFRLDWLIPLLLIVSPGQSLIYAHIAFNLSLLIVALPLCRPLERLMLSILPGGAQTTPDRYDEISVLDHGALGAPQMAIASLKRELLRMMGLVERMFEPIQSLYESGDKASMRAVKLQDNAVNAALLDIRRYVAAIPIETCSKEEAKIVRSLI